MKKQHYRTVWISDVHLGTKGCKAEYLESFLNSFTTEHLYLVGDIIDGWMMRKNKSYFPQQHVNIIRKILSKARKGTNVYYTIGNHDEFLRKYKDFFIGNTFGNIEIADEFVHETVDGKKLWIIHGDLYDGVIRHHKWLCKIGAVGYNGLLYVNRLFNIVRRKFGFGYWSLSAFIKYKVKKAVDFINSFEQTIVYECKKRGYDGVVCGHIHHAEIKEIDGIVYHNDGDFVESCTALVEHIDGKIELIVWHTVDHKTK